MAALENGPALVLLVEDDGDSRELFRAAFSAAGFGTALAFNGNQALDKALELLPALVVTDLAIPGIDGFELTRQLRANPKTAHIPILGVTGYPFAQLTDRQTRAGIDRLLLKPFEPDDLVAEARTLLGRRNS